MNTRLRVKDVQPGLEYMTPAMVVTEAHIVNFAGLSGDFFDVHMDDEFAREAGFPGRVAHGLLCLSLIDGLKNRSAVLFDAIASLEWSYKFKQAVFPGDRIYGRIRVIDVRLTKNPARGIIRLHVEVRNQSDIVVQEGENTLLARA